MKLYRQGDLLFREIECLPKGLKKKADKVLAYGEVTGHSHRFPDNANVALFLNAKNQTFLQVSDVAGSLIIHEEHNPFIIEKGNYEIINEKEWDYFEQELRKVVD